MTETRHGYKLIDYAGYEKISGSEAKAAYIAAEMRDADYICITDALTNRNRGGALVLRALEDQSRHGMVDADGFSTGANPRTWKLFCKRDEWGDEVKPGSYVEYEVSIGNRRNQVTKKKINPRQRREIIRRGDPDPWVLKKRALVDDDKCITLGYDDAVTFLNNHGIHYDSNMGLSGMREHMRHDVKHPSGEMRRTWYWRYVERVPWQGPTNDKADSDSDAEPTEKRGPGRPKKK